MTQTAPARPMLAGAAGAPASPLRTRAFRPDIEGLRAVSVAVVVAYHAGVPLTRGGFVGVDVFFVISGFLITGMLLREVRDTGRIDVVAFYARRARRLLPAALTVLAATCLLARIVGLSQLSFRALMHDTAFSAASLMNLHLIRANTDYFAANSTPSALLHFWSLSVEEQFYLVWPATILCLALFLRRGRRSRARHQARTPIERPVAALLALVVAGSFAVSLHQSSATPIWAYFGPQSRAWELGLGGLVAVAAARLSGLPRRLMSVATWVGLLLVLASVVLLSDDSRFPGVAALWPTIGAALLIGGGCAAPDGRSAAVVLGRKPFAFIGARSYSIYLWHWPLLVLLPELSGGESTPLMTLAAVVCCVGLSCATYQWVETPFRTARRLRARPGLALSAGLASSGGIAAASLLVVAVMGPIVGTGPSRAAAPLPWSMGTSTDTHLSERLHAALASALQPAAVPADLDPSLENVRADLPAPYADGCHAGFSEVRVLDGLGTTRCVYADTRSKTKVVLLGDSHALQWFPAAQAVAAQHHWQLVSATKSACPVFNVQVWQEDLKREYRECDAWRDDAIEKVVRLHPQVVILTARMSLKDHGLHDGSEGLDRDWAAGVADTVKRLRAGGAKVLVLDDTPLLGKDGPNCLSGSLDDSAACAADRALAAEPVSRRDGQRRAAEAAGAVAANPLEWLCDSTRCPVLIDDFIVYRDDNHLTPSASRWLAPALDDALVRAGVLTSVGDEQADAAG